MGTPVNGAVALYGGALRPDKPYSQAEG